MRLRKIFNIERDFNLFLLAGLFSGIGAGINTSIFNNYLSDIFKLSEDIRGFLEVPREAPGFFIMLILAALSFWGDVRIAMLGMAAAGLGMLGLGMLSPTFALMIIWMMMYSLGTHMVMPVTPSIGMSLSNQESFGARLGTISAFGLSGSIIAYVYIFLGFNFMHMTYQTAFITGTVFYVFAAFAVGMMKKGGPEVRKVKFVFRKRYLLYYVLAVISGARNQIFLTFAPWVLIKVFDVKPQMFAILGMVVALISIGTRKIIGKLIDTRGERFVLTLEAILLFAICLGYAFADRIFSAGVAVVIIAGCYVIDNSMSAVEMARSTYVRKIAVDLADVTPTLSTGVSLQHIASMVIPIFGGLLWLHVGYQAVFMAAAVIAFLNLVLSQKIKIMS
ncbi:MAG TPA: MFS transporter [Negativicutes bacterium]|nr:MFS transporter [Negativicutes bacterium]